MTNDKSKGPANKYSICRAGSKLIKQLTIPKKRMYIYGEGIDRGL